MVMTVPQARPGVYRRADACAGIIDAAPRMDRRALPAYGGGMRWILLALAISGSAAAVAQPHTTGECREGSDFIRNAALARDAGTSREFFVGRLEEDLAAIRAFPPELRWFVYDADDEAFLRAEVAAVFDAPRSSDEHQQGFLARCVQYALGMASHGR
jgi:hypothetical protein